MVPRGIQVIIQLEGVEHVVAHSGQPPAGTTVFSFTDNLTTYWVATSGSSPLPCLHARIEVIRLLKMELDCCLQVVHVPGVVMIDQGTDDLSRGIWVSPFHGLTDWC